MLLRPYQRDALDFTYEWFRNNSGHPIIVLPTGSGKSLVMAALIKEAFEQWPDQRILIVTHSRELIVQNYAELLKLWPEAKDIAGIYSAGIGRRDHSASVLFAGIQSIHAKAELIGHTDLCIIDEAHLISGRSTSMYRKFIVEMERINPNVKCLGLTATHYRLDQGFLTSGDNKLFDAVSYEAGVGDLIDDGYLCPLISKFPLSQIDTKGVGTRAGEFIASELAKAAQPATEAAVREIVQYAADRRALLVFGCSVEHSEQIASALHGHGISVETVFGDTKKIDRDHRIDAFKRGEIRALVSCGVLTTGFNAPSIDLIALLRPTKSAGLFVQMVGRGLRNAPGKKNCLVLDHGGNLFRFGPIDEIKPKNKNKRDEPGEAPVKHCPACREIIAAAWRTCPDCGHTFPPPDPKVEERASYLRIMNGSMKPETFSVDGVSFSSAGAYGLRVVYTSNGNKFTKWIDPEARDYRLSHYKKWWEQHGLNEPPPTKCKDLMAMADQIPVPDKVLVRRKPNKKGFVVMKCEFGDGND